jgi:hypothetical protein
MVEESCWAAQEPSSLGVGEIVESIMRVYILVLTKYSLGVSYASWRLHG